MEYPFQGTIATTDGETLWVFRYSSAGKSRSLFFTRDVHTLRQQYPDLEILREVSDDARLVVSEPMGDLPGAWVEMPEASHGVVGKAGDRLLPVCSRAPAEGNMTDRVRLGEGYRHEGAGLRSLPVDLRRLPDVSCSRQARSIIVPSPASGLGGPARLRSGLQISIVSVMLAEGDLR